MKFLGTAIAAILILGCAGKPARYFQVDDVVLGPGLPDATADADGTAWDGATHIPATAFEKVTSETTELTYESALKVADSLAKTYPAPKVEIAFELASDGDVIARSEPDECWVNPSEPQPFLCGVGYEFDESDEVEATELELRLYQYQVDPDAPVVTVEVSMSEVDYPYGETGSVNEGGVDVRARTGGAVLFVQTSRYVPWLD